MAGINTAIHTFHLIGNNQFRFATIKAIGKRSESKKIYQGLLNAGDFLMIGHA
jgi:hypothetical protein